MRVWLIDATGRGRRAEVGLARTPDERARGLAFRTVPAAMLFAFPADTRAAFTTREMRFCLDFLFINAAGVVVDRRACVPPGPVPVVSAAPYRYVLELPSEWLSASGLGPVSRVAWHPSDLPAPV